MTQNNKKNRGIMFAASGIAVATLLSGAVATMPAMAAEATGATATVSQTAAKKTTTAKAKAAKTAAAEGLNDEETQWLSGKKDVVSGVIPGFDPATTDYYGVAKDKIASAAEKVPSANTGLSLLGAPIEVDTAKSGYLVGGKVQKDAPADGDVVYQVAIKGKKSGNTVLYTVHSAAEPSTDTGSGDKGDAGSGDNTGNTGNSNGNGNGNGSTDNGSGDNNGSDAGKDDTHTGLNTDETTYLTTNADKISQMIPGFTPKTTDYYGIQKTVITKAATAIPLAGDMLKDAPISIDTTQSGYLVDGKVTQTAPTDGDITYQVAITGKKSGNTVLYKLHTAAKPSTDDNNGKGDNNNGDTDHKGDGDQQNTLKYDLDLSQAGTYGYYVSANAQSADGSVDDKTMVVKPGEYTFAYTMKANDELSSATATGTLYSSHTVAQPSGNLKGGEIIGAGDMTDVKLRDPNAKNVAESDKTTYQVSVKVTLKEGQYGWFVGGSHAGVVHITGTASQTGTDGTNTGDSTNNSGDTGSNTNTGSTTNANNGSLAQTGLAYGLIAGIMGVLATIGGVFTFRRHKMTD